MPRIDGRQPDELREIQITPAFLKKADGSVFIEWGDTRVIIAVTIEDRVPPFLLGTGQGWLTADYTMLTRTGGTRLVGSADRSGNIGRATEIRRFIGRSLRAALDRHLLGERTIYIDCDVLEADGGTRVASVTGGWVALALACKKWMETEVIHTWPLIHQVAAVSLGLIEDQIYLDLNYFEDSRADVDVNIVMATTGELVEFQLTGEHALLPVNRIQPMLEIAWVGLRSLYQIQRNTLRDIRIEPLGRLYEQSIPETIL